MSAANLLSNRYELGETLGYGGMSEVHHGHDVRLGREVAVKILRADLARDAVFQERFRREAQNSAALNHPAIVAVYDTGETQSEYGPLPYIVMEYVEGRTLRDIIKTEGPMDQKRAMEIMADVCAALDFSHRHGIIHRDVKPANVMISRTGAVKVMDFGIARAIHDGQAAMTQTAAVIGTAQYLSPEQARGESVDARSDVYAAGCVLFELLTGEPPFTGDSPVSVAYQHVREDPVAPSTINPAVSPELDAVVLKALTKGPANRYQSAAEMRSDLVRVLSNQRPAAPMVMSDEERTQVMSSTGRHAVDRYEDDYPDEEADRKSNRRKLMVALAALGVIGVFLALWLGGLFDSGDERAPVPNIIGQQKQAAQMALREAGFTNVKWQPVKCIATEWGADPACDKDQDNLKVLSTDPRHGVQIAKTDELSVRYGVLPDQVTMPTVTDRTKEDAIKRLQEKKLLVNPEMEEVPNDDPDKAGRIAEQNPAAGSKVLEGDEVTLKVYAKPEMVTVTDFTGQMFEEAKAGLEGAGLKVERKDVDSSDPEGTVVSQDPNSGQVVKGSVVTLEVSNGANAEIEMPYLVGLTLEEAKAKLKEAGHKGEVKVVEEQTDDQNQNGRVASTEPGERQKLQASDAVVLHVYRFEGDGNGGGGGGDDDPGGGDPPCGGPLEPPCPPGR
ncbi:Stk1 family PASTA domain-containing Ser/Thr kinase [Thermocrispum municipale]|uniref:Stk1 family PASTA domain-containing Ser/Thr kinase n=1 Tax=Thermocrispum municipale TaxID=37926 RepID=UPI00041A67A0|nr:Stk1 family PASTA domain-containing Ser/Thr kinase [Thermocrispum municipale]